MDHKKYLKQGTIEEDEEEEEHSTEDCNVDKKRSKSDKLGALAAKVRQRKKDEENLRIQLLSEEKQKNPKKTKKRQRESMNNATKKGNGKLMQNTKMSTCRICQFFTATV